MATFLTLTLIGFIIYLLSRPKEKSSHGLPKSNYYSEDDLIRDRKLSDSRVLTKEPVSMVDNSIVDITGETYQITPTELGFNLVKYTDDVPFWSHKYVYSFSDINNASNAQLQFYRTFKKSFLEDIFLDLEGNTNYAFILLFDLLIDYELHKDIHLLEKQLYALGQCYPKTKSYGRSFLVERMAKVGDQDGITRLRTQQSSEIQQYYQTDYEDWRLGVRYKTKLKLSKQETDILNNFYYSSNNFSGIDFCNLEIIKLFLATIKELTNRYSKDGKPIKQQFEIIGDIIARKHFKYRANSYNYKYTIESTPKDIYSIAFKYCENAVRELYGHKRKVNTDTYYTHVEITTVLDEITSQIKEVINSLLPTVAEPDEATEIDLYAKNTNRWKRKFEEISIDLSDGKKFIEEIKRLAYLNKRNPSAENIYFEASKCIAPINKEASLTLYIYYLYQDLNSSTFDNKKLTKTIQKSLFKTSEQLHDFEEVISELIKDRKLEKALESVSKIYVPKRKKIALDKEAIEVVHQRHSGTVELLNEYLKDELEDSENIVTTKQLNNEELQIQITPKIEAPKPSLLTNDILLDNNQTELLNLFVKSSLTVSQMEMNVFVKSNGLFKNQLIESINDVCYEVLDDILIEEEEDNYIINENYYQRIFRNDR
ncbi:tellurite resistance TerB C-terminal domain-containing protein [Pedobacter sp. P351]|uniref:tellurite resistance TerB C-terminal domain-containing protein n=1 Tax=Pedobacter superstes TaxID=3133441 RepID=UPI0030B6427A